MANVSIMGGSAALLEAISVEMNGTYYPDEGYDGFSAVTVDVPLGTKTITQNGIYNAGDDNLAGYSRVTVNQPQPVLISKQITQNGTYYASSDNATGYNIVEVNVAGGATLTGTTLLNSTINRTGTTALLDDYTKYDFIEFMCGDPSVLTVAELKLVTVDELKDIFNSNKTYTMSGFASRFIHFTMSTSSITVTNYDSLPILKITGYKLV